MREWWMVMTLELIAVMMSMMTMIINNNVAEMMMITFIVGVAFTLFFALSRRSHRKRTQMLAKVICILS